MAYFGGIFFANIGGGGGQNYFQICVNFVLQTRHRKLACLWQGKKSIHHQRGTPLFSVCRPTPRSQSKKNYGVLYHFPGKTREKGLHHGSGKKGIHHRASDPEKEKRRVSTVVVYTFSSLFGIDLRVRVPQLWAIKISTHQLVLITSSVLIRSHDAT